MKLQSTKGKMKFEWDKGNRLKSWIKHKVSIQEQEEAFYDKQAKRLRDKKHSEREERFLLLAETKQKRRLLIAYTIREVNKIRCISARPMNRKEVITYEETTQMA